MEKQKGLMTEGVIWKELVLFSLPLLFGNIFQLLYNTVDSIVVGNYVGKSALAAVGASTPLINLLIAFFMGLATGAGVIVSRYYGAKKYVELSKAIHTFLLFTLLFGIVMTIVGVSLSPWFLMLVKTPSDILNQASDYLRIYFMGIIPTMIYNACAGIIQAVGNSKKTLYYLTVASIVNICLDIIFVYYFNMGVKGVAYATVIATCISMILAMFTLLTSKNEYKVSFKKLSIDLEVLSQIVRIGIPAGIQGMIVSFSNLIVQAYINSFGTAAIAGFSSANKFDNFLGMPINSFALAITTFTGQNVGANKLDRVKKGVNTCLKLSIATVVLVGVISFIFAENCIMIFNKDSEVVKIGALMMRLMIPFYFTLCFHQIYCGAIRGGGASLPPTVISIFAFCVVRQIFLMLTMAYFKHIAIVALGYSITWSIAAMISSYYYHKVNWIKNFG